MIRNISLITFLMLFMISCSNVKILDKLIKSYQLSSLSFVFHIGVSFRRNND